MIGKFNVLVIPKGWEGNKKQNCLVVNSVLTLQGPAYVVATFLITQKYRTRVPPEC
jgi:hypothetical protein